MSGLLLAGSLASGLSAAADTPKPLIDLIHIENGTKDGSSGRNLEGGNFTAIVVGDQVFGVLYGSAEHPAPVTIFTVFTRALGVATVTDDASRKVLKQNATLPVRTLVAMRLDALFEFRDLNGDGIFDFRPASDNDTNVTRDAFDLLAREPLVKGASLVGDWNETGFDLRVVSDNEVDVALTLTLNGTGYRMVLDRGADGDGAVNAVSFTIHVAVTRSHLSSSSVPHFAATVERSGGTRTLTSLTPDGTVNASFWSTRAAFKVDHDIVGWDFAPARLGVESKLLLHTTLLYLNAIDERLATWLNDGALGGGRDGNATVDDAHAETTVTAARPLTEFQAATKLGFNDQWHRVGGLDWVSNVSVWPNATSDAPVNETAHFQVLGGFRVSGDLDGRDFRGLVLSGGFVYPQGYRILHDPQLDVASVEVDGSAALPGVLSGLILVGEVGLTLAAVAGVVLLAARGASKRAQGGAAREAERLEALKARYNLPAPSDPPRRGEQ